MQIIPNIQIVQYMCEIVQNVPNVQPIPWCWPQNLQCGPAAPPYDQWKLPTSSERPSSPWSLPYLSTPSPPFTCPKEERPNWDSWFILGKTCVLCASGAKSCIVYCLMGCLPFLFKPPPRLPEEVCEHWTDTSELVHCHWSNTKITDHIYLKPALHGRWKSYFVTYFKVSHTYAAKQCSDKMWVLVQGKESKRATFNAGKFFQVDFKSIFLSSRKKFKDQREFPFCPSSFYFSFHPCCHLQKDQVSS